MLSCRKPSMLIQTTGVFIAETVAAGVAGCSIFFAVDCGLLPEQLNSRSDSAATKLQIADCFIVIGS
jgi:hypothetical protein